MNANRNVLIGLLCVLFLLMQGCVSQQSALRSSVVEYLYPTSNDQKIEVSIPVLTLPIKVGIAFVPEQASRTQRRNVWSGAVENILLTEAYKMQLLERVADHFRGREFISEIEVIPSPYLTPAGSFANLDQIRTMYGVDVIALVSFDQVQFTDEDALSMSYWTIVGAYVVSGEKNDTSTMLDTAVYDIQSRKLLFRAPGISNIKGNATLVNLSQELRNDSQKGFDEAAKHMVANLDVELDRFKEKIKKNPERVKVMATEGYHGGGALAAHELAGLLMLALGGWLYRRRHVNTKV